MKHSHQESYVQFNLSGNLPEGKLPSDKRIIVQECYFIEDEAKAIIIFKLVNRSNYPIKMASTIRYG